MIGFHLRKSLNKCPGHKSHKVKNPTIKMVSFHLFTFITIYSTTVHVQLNLLQRGEPGNTLCQTGRPFGKSLSTISTPCFSKRVYSGDRRLSYESRNWTILASALIRLHAVYDGQDRTCSTIKR